TGVLLSANWLIFIWAIQVDRVLEVSLGYYINPLINVVLGIVVLHERLRRWQIAAVILATVGVAYQTMQLGSVPWVSLTLASLFGVYALLRKQIDVASLPGSMVETMFMLPFGAVYLVWLYFNGTLAFGHIDARTDWLAALAGLITVIPLWWVIIASKRINYATLGICQYLAPSGHFLLAVLVYKEPFGSHQLITFACIWTALIIYTVDSIVDARRTPAIA
ncbi:MAG: EamA family transporter RarD, partial [Gammaproteobacteria bacterium]|nr:EamA family transporter RarD [Gammaproteobacteria bacterium]